MPIVMTIVPVVITTTHYYAFMAQRELPNSRWKSSLSVCQKIWLSYISISIPFLALLSYQIAGINLPFAESGIFSVPQAVQSISTTVSVLLV